MIFQLLFVFSRNGYIFAAIKQLFDMFRIKENIGKILKSRSLTFATLALKIGTSAQNVHAQLSREYPNLEILSRISEALGVSVGELVDGPRGEEVVIHCPHCGCEMSLEVKVK